MRRLLPLLPLLLFCVERSRAQDGVTAGIIADSDPMNVAITARGGVTLASPRGDFPSLIIGDSRRATGAIAQQYGSGEIGSRLEVAALIPFHPVLGVSLAFGSQLLSVSYPSDTLRHPTRFDLQTLEASLGLQWSALHEPASYIYGGLRSIYIDGGIDVGLATIGNRVAATSFDDTLGGGAASVTGSFTSGEPFRHVVALRAGVGLRFAATPNIEIVLETSYSAALNPVFSSDAIEENEFAIDVLRAVVGVGYRF